jgi:hypothetical protein
LVLVVLARQTEIMLALLAIIQLRLDLHLWQAAVAVLCQQQDHCLAHLEDLVAVEQEHLQLLVQVDQGQPDKDLLEDMEQLPCHMVVEEVVEQAPLAAYK